MLRCKVLSCCLKLVFDSRKIKLVGRVKGWRAYIRVRWRFRRFRAGPQSGSHRHVSSPCSPNPACRFPAPGSPVESCTSYTDRRAIRACRWSDSPTSSAAATRRPLCIPSRVRRAVEPVHASTTSNLYRPTPSLMHVMLPESSPSTRGLGIATPARLLPSDIAPHLRPLSGRALARAPVGGGFPAPPFRLRGGFTVPP